MWQLVGNMAERTGKVKEVEKNFDPNRNDARSRLLIGVENVYLTGDRFNELSILVGQVQGVSGLVGQVVTYDTVTVLGREELSYVVV